ncbi:dynein regulatory complex protein 9-like [Achroia grisella]|uniref:dynein regulatory complex protein 9-like n=1 Tax=Achroia grisella TaxID=688607 RepID=UPI0027D31513|nr:dynein regulatory complex protein 9-like [Achroia grisella]
MDALLFALTLEVVLLQIRILEGTTKLKANRKYVSKHEKAQRDKLTRDRQMVKDVIRSTLIEIAETGQWYSLQQASKVLEIRFSSAISMYQKHEQLEMSLEAIVKDLITNRNQWILEIHNADKRIALLRDKMKDDFQNAKARFCYAEKWVVARAESLELQLNVPRPPLPRSDYEKRVHEELIRAYELQIKEREESLVYWKERYTKDFADICGRVSKRCEQLRVAIARHEELQKLYDLHEGEMRGWLTFKRERAARIALQERLNTAAKRIQSWWRGMMVRRAFGQFRYLRSAKKSPSKSKKK